jgi:hypothetical protein
MEKREVAGGQVPWNGVAGEQHPASAIVDRKRDYGSIRFNLPTCRIDHAASAGQPAGVYMACFEPLLVWGRERLRHAALFGDDEETRPRNGSEDNRSIVSPVCAALARRIGKRDWSAPAHRDLLHLPVGEEPEPL